MKTSKLLLLALISILTFNSCSDDDNVEDSKSYAQLIIGEWSYTSQTLNGSEIAFNDECQQNFEHQFYNIDGTYYQTEFENLTGNGCEQVDSSNGNWSIEDNTMNLTVLGDSYTIEIVTLNDSTLKYKLSIDYDGDGNIDEFTQTLSRVL